MKRVLELKQRISLGVLSKCLVLALLTVCIGGCDQILVPKEGFEQRFYRSGLTDGSAYNFPTTAAIAVDARTGNILIGGRFSSIDYAPAFNIARYDPVNNNWSALSSSGLVGAGFGPEVVVTALAISGDNLYVGGSFTQTGDNSVNGLNYIARYNAITDTWSELTDLGLNNVVYGLTASDGFLFVRGAFIRTFNGATNLDRLARYNTADNTWAAITLDADVYTAALSANTAARSGNNLFIGGSFSGVDSGVSRYFARIYLQQWNVPASTTDWFNDTNWTTGAVPAANTNAVIPANAGSIDINSADVTLRDLMLGGGVLNVGAGRTLTINGILGLKGGTINGAGTVVITNCKPDGILGGAETTYILTALVRCVNDIIRLLPLHRNFGR